MHELDKTLEALKPCPFCGGEARVSHYETESLWSHDQVTYTKVSCDECEISFQTEPGYETEAIKAWNSRASSTSAGVTEEQTPRDEAWELTHQNGKRWTIVGPNNKWEMRPVGFITADEAEQICRAAIANEASRSPVSQKEAVPVALTYTNYKGETASRTITPRSIWFGSTEWHSEPQYLVRAFDHDKQAERDFALKDFGHRVPSPAKATPQCDRCDGIADGVIAWLGRHGIMDMGGEVHIGDVIDALNGLIEEPVHSSPTPVSAPVGVVEYRLLDSNDTVQADDEFIADDAVTWVRPDGWAIGMRYSHVFKSMRRALRSPAVEGK